MTDYKSAILVIEDDANDQELIKVAFGSFGLSGVIHFVSGGIEAIAYMMGEGKYSDRAKYPYPKFIITDLKMPHGNGFDVLSHLKANPTFSIIPTVVLTASSDPDDVKMSYMLGASSYHVKPRTFPELCSQLKVLHDYWMTCQVPEVDASGKQIPTDPKGKLGEAFPQPSQSEQTRLNP
jgi:CheY-like chemotaxis protein